MDTLKLMFKRLMSWGKKYMNTITIEHNNICPIFTVASVPKVFFPFHFVYRQFKDFNFFIRNDN